MRNETRVWSYVRREMNAEERTTFEYACASNPGLRSAVDEAKRLDEKLQHHFQAQDIGQERMIDKIVAALEVASSDACTSRKRGGTAKQNVLRGGLLALAAGIVLLLGLSYPACTLQFSELSIEGTRSKGGAPEQLAGRYTEEDLVRSVEALWVALDRAYKERYRNRGLTILFQGRPRLQVDTTVEELRAGKLYAYVEVFDPVDSEPRVRMARYWNSLQEFEEDVEPFSEDIVQEMFAARGEDP